MRPERIGASERDTAVERVKKVALCVGSWSSGSITVPGASEYDLFSIVFSNSDPNEWPCVCNKYWIGSVGGKFRINATFFGVVSSMNTVFSSALIEGEGDELTISYKTDCIVGALSNPFQSSSSQQSRIRRIEAYA